MPPLRLGHGLYTCDLRSEKGKKLLADMRELGVTLEFQITSNVRLNNLSRLERHPLRRYLKAGVRCVQGTDGGALYGTNSIDEELSLEKLLGLTPAELRRMREGEDGILEESRRVFNEKAERFKADCPGDIERFYRARLESADRAPADLWKGGDRVAAEEALADLIRPLPEGLTPIVVAGGSFNSSRRRTPLRDEDRAFIDDLLEKADPARVCFVVGHALAAQEGYLARQAVGRFQVYAIVPNRLTRAQAARLNEARPGVLVSIESTGAGLYKSFAYEIFKRQPSALIAFDGNSAALNLIQEARNARRKCRIFINPRSRGLTAKGRVLEGYVQPLGNAEDVLSEI